MNFFNFIKKKARRNSSDIEKEFLDEINKSLPEHIDWKKGAVEYLNTMLSTEGEGAKIFHLLKPFIVGSDFKKFYEDMYKFLNVLQLLDLPKGSTILDVGCGPGWIAHYLGKLGYSALGIDISHELIGIAKERLMRDVSPFPHNEFPVQFMVHDIESGAAEVNYLFDAAILESSLHHFYDPISALKNIAKNLKENGIVVILEGFAPEQSSDAYKNLFDVMKKYSTLERPYSQNQIIRLFGLTGFQHFRFLYPVSGFRELGMNDEREYQKLYVDGPDFNYIFASRSEESITKLGTGQSSIAHDNYCKASILIKNFPKLLNTDDVHEINVKIKNISNDTWPCDDNANLYSFNFSYHWLDAGGKVVIFDGLRTPLHGFLKPNADIDLSAKVQAPDKPGDYIIEFDLVREFITWFGEKGSETVRIDVKVEDKKY